MGYATTYAARETAAEVVFRDSIALRESYQRYEAFVLAGQFDYIVIESASPSWEHDSLLIKRLHQLLPRLPDRRHRPDRHPKRQDPARPAGACLRPRRV